VAGISNHLRIYSNVKEVVRNIG